MGHHNLPCFPSFVKEGENLSDTLFMGYVMVFLKKRPYWVMRDAKLSKERGL